jgi:hypothetical protein
MRKNRVVEQNRCSRLAHRAFFLDDEEKDRAVRDNEIVGVPRDVGDTGKELFKFLFGNK